MSRYDTDVLIAGAGPTGLMLACQLARYGVPFIIIDKSAGPSVTSKAMVVQARTLEFYDQLGIAATAIERGSSAPGAVFHINGERAAYLPVGDIGKGVSPFPFVLALGQDANEKILTEWLAAHGHQVEWNTELTAYAETGHESIRDSGAGIAATLCGAAGSTRPVTARWLAGCDGAHSAVRHLAKIDFPGAPYEQEFFVADIVARGIEADRHLNIFVRPGGFHLLFPMAGIRHFRLIGILPPALRAKPDLSLDDIAAAVAPDLSPGFAIESHGWWSRYRISHRRAAHFRSGHALLLGDAGHIHSPAGGQGMNTGLQDACNLGWKLALVCQGTTSAELLDSYAHEREGVAERLVNTTDRAFTLAVSESFIARLFRTHVAARLLGRMLRIEAVRRLAFATVSQTGIRYRDSPLSRNGEAMPDQAVQAGDRLPWMSLSFAGSAGALSTQDIYALLREPGFHLFLFAPQADAIANAQAWCTAAAIKVQLHVAPASPHNQAEWTRQRTATPRALLVRPDGHIGWCAAEFNPPAGDAWLKDQLHLL